MSHDVIISYSSHDKLQADAICNRLESQGIRCWIAPRDVPSGTEYAMSIVQAIDSSEVLVLVYSSHADQSEQVKREVERAVSRGIKIAPVRIEDAEMSESFEYYVGSIHWLDAITPPLEEHIDKLASDLKKLLVKDSASDDAAAASGGGSMASAAADVQGAEPAAPVAPIPPPVVDPPAPAPRRGLMIGAAALVVAIVAAAVWFWPRSITVPAVADMAVAEASRALSRNFNVVVKFENSDEDAGQVIRTEPGAGESAGKKSDVQLFVSGTVVMPDLRGNRLADALETLESKRLPVSSGIEQPSFSAESIAIVEEPSGEDEGVVLRTEPASGKRILLGDNVTIYVSEAKIGLPDVVGQPYASAVEALPDLNVEKILDWKPDLEEGTVFKSEPAAGARVSRNATVNLFVAGKGGWVYLPDEGAISQGADIEIRKNAKTLRKEGRTGSVAIGTVPLGASVRVLQKTVDGGWTKVVIN